MSKFGSSIGNSPNRFITFDEELGAGSFGSVFKGFDTMSGIHVAVKEAQIGKGARANQIVKSLQQEFNLLVTLSHPNIVAVYDYSISEGKAKLYMEWLPSGSIQDILSMTGFRLHEYVTRRYIREALLGLSYLHSKSVLHRDIKPANMLVSATGAVKLSDFGTSKQTVQGTGNTSNQIVGTTRYMAPESITKNNYSAASDIWAIACSIVQMLSGEIPWSHIIAPSVGDSVSVIFQIGTAKEPEHHPVIPLHVSHPLRRLLESCFSKEPSQRPTATDLLHNAYFQDPRPASTSLEASGEKIGAGVEVSPEIDGIETDLEYQQRFAEARMMGYRQASSSSCLSSDQEQPSTSNTDQVPTMKTTTKTTSQQRHQKQVPEIYFTNVETILDPTALFTPADNENDEEEEEVEESQQLQNIETNIEQEEQIHHGDDNSVLVATSNNDNTAMSNDDDRGKRKGSQSPSTLPHGREETVTTVESSVATFSPNPQHATASSLESAVVRRGVSPPMHRKWQYEKHYGKWIDFSVGDSKIITNAFNAQNGKGKFALHLQRHLDGKNTCYELDFGTMTQVNKTTGYKRKIRMDRLSTKNAENTKQRGSSSLVWTRDEHGFWEKKEKPEKK